MMSNSGQGGFRMPESTLGGRCGCCCLFVSEEEELTAAAAAAFLDGRAPVELAGRKEDSTTIPRAGRKGRRRMLAAVRMEVLAGIWLRSCRPTAMHGPTLGSSLRTEGAQESLPPSSLLRPCPRSPLSPRPHPTQQPSSSPGPRASPRSCLLIGSVTFPCRS